MEVLKDSVWWPNVLVSIYHVKALLTSICFAAFLTSYGQTPLIDSLEQRLQNSEMGDEEKVDIMNDLSFKVHRTDLEKAFYYARAALKLADKIQYKKGIAGSYFALGVTFWEKGDLDSALIADEKAIVIYDDLGLIGKAVRSRMNKAIILENKDDYPNAIALYEKILALIKEHKLEGMTGVVSYNMGLVFNKMGNWNAAIERYFTMVDYAKEVGNNAYQTAALQSIGNAYMRLDDTENAFEAYESAFEIATKAGNKRQKADALRGLGRVLSSNNQLDSALFYFQEALKIQKSLKRNIGVALMIESIAEISKKQERFEEALNYELQALAIYRELLRHNVIAKTMIRIGQIKILMKEIDQAQPYLTEGYSIVDSTGHLISKVYATEALANFYEIKGNYAKAFEFQKKHSIYKDSLLSETKIKELGLLEARYEFDRERQLLVFEQDKERLQLEKEKEVISTQLIAVAGGLLLLIISTGFIVRAYRGKTKANQKLQQLDAFKTRFFANINHDFRTPLTLMQGYIHRIGTNKDDYLTTRSKEDLENLSSNALTLTEMTNEIQNLILLEEGKLRLKFHTLDMNTYLKTQVLMFSSMAELAGIDLTYESDVETLSVNIDSGHFEKILYNLLSNAFKFTSKGEQIIVGLKEENQRVILTISDTGKGISSEDLPNVFDRFYQSPLNEYRSKEGFGIGLAVVNELVELHGGTIDVISEVDRGTTFTIVLPFNLDKERAEEPMEESVDKIKSLPTKQAKDHMISSNLPGHSVLVVDDHEEIRQYIIDLIKEEYEVKEAANGKQALEVLKVDKVDLILTDLMMPWLDGFDLIEKLKENETLSDIPVMVVSARTTEEDKHRVLDAGVNEFISKPFDPVMLQKRIRNLLADNVKGKNTWKTIIEDKDLQSNLEGNILKKLNQVILDHISDSDFSTQSIADELSASRSKAIRLIKELTGQTPLEYIKTIRMDFVQKAVKSGKIKNASEAAVCIGMSNPTQFSAQYKKHFGEAPFPK